MDLATNLNSGGTRRVRRHARPLAAAVLVGAVTASIALLGAPAANAAGTIPVSNPGAAPIGAAAESSQTGWVRIGHFSPNTSGVDVQITALAGGAMAYSLDDVTYGQLSKYFALNAGTYVVAMRPSGSTASSNPMISQSITVTPGSAQTVAAYGKRKSLKLVDFSDNLTGPATGDARIRLIQTSTDHKKVNVKTTTGLAIATDAQAGTATGYASVPAGTWTLAVSGSGAKDSTTVSLADGTVDTLVVLDNAKGGVSLSTVVDSASVGAAPVGGVQTGGGWLSDHCLTTAIPAAKHTRSSAASAVFGASDTSR